MNNQVFSWSRFVLALRKEIVENWRQLTLALVVLYVVMTVLMLFGNWAFSDNITEEAVVLRSLVVFYAFSISTIIMASLAFRGLLSKADRTELFTSPSSMTEKFTVNVLVYVVAYIIAFFIIVQLADLTRFVLLLPARSETFIVPGPINFIPSVTDFLSTVTPSGEMKHLQIFKAGILVSLVASPGMYLLGSTLWPRLSFLKTLAVSYGISLLVFIVGMILICSTTSPRDVAFLVVEKMQDGTFAIGTFIAAAVQAVLYWWLAWVVFRRKDIVSRGVFH